MNLFDASAAGPSDVPDETDGGTGADVHLDGVDLVFEGAHHALSGIDLHCSAGEFIAIVGPSGCGKSSMLRLMAGLIPPTTGRVRTAVEDGRLSVGFVFQQANLLPWRSVRNNIRLPLEMAGYALARQDQLARQARQWIGLTEEDEPKWPRQLSGGMQMRVALARALVTRPNLLLMDEPFAAIDDLLRMRFNEEIIQLWQSQQWTAVLVTHNVAEAVFVSQRVLVMRQSPGTITTSIDIPFGYPRTSKLRGTPEFAAVTHAVATALQGNADPPQGSSP